MPANPFDAASLRDWSELPTSTAMTRSANCEATDTGRLSTTPPSMHVRSATRPGGKKPGSAHDAYTASRTETSSSPGSPQTTRAPRFRSTVFTSNRFGSSAKVTSGSAAAHSARNGSSR